METLLSPRSLLLPPELSEAIRGSSLGFKSVSLSPEQLADLELLLSGALFPLTGYLPQEDFESCLDRLRLHDGTPWALPISLDISAEMAALLQPGDKLALRDGEGFMLAVLTVESVFPADVFAVARSIFGQEQPANHPGAAAYVRRTKSYRVGGPVEGLSLPLHCDFTELRRPPAKMRELVAERNWTKVLGCLAPPFPTFQDKAEFLDAALCLNSSILLLHPVGDAMAQGAEHFASVRCVSHFAAGFPPSMMGFGLLPYYGIGAGPRQALHEALILKNFGCTHMLVGAHHGDPDGECTEAPCYARGEAQRLVERFADETGIAMTPRQEMVYVEGKAHYMARSSVSADDSVQTLAPAAVRHRLEFDLSLPDWYTLPEIEDDLRQAFPPRSRQGITLFMTGLSGAGKSTLARLLYVKLMELRTRPVTLLDGDIVRRRLSSDLTFSKAHRNLNIERIAFVASEITKNGGIAVCAPIAPYASSRATAREMVSTYGGFIEIYVATPLEVCEQRDRKGLYAKARSGLLKGVTGIDDPYEAPASAEIVLDTTKRAPGECVQEVLLYLKQQGYLA